MLSLTVARRADVCVAATRALSALDSRNGMKRMAHYLFCCLCVCVFSGNRYVQRYAQVPQR